MYYIILAEEVHVRYDIHLLLKHSSGFLWDNVEIGKDKRFGALIPDLARKNSTKKDKFFFSK